MKELGDWPEVWKTGDGSYRLEAVFRSPRRWNWLHFYPLWVALAAFGLMIFFAPWFGWTRAGSVFAAMWLAALFGLLWHHAMRLLVRERLVMTIRDGGAVWQGPSPVRKRWSKLHRYVLEPGAAYECGVLPQHRFAAEEQRGIADGKETGRFKPGDQIDALYALTSDLTILTGVGKHIDLRVAEICDDEHGRRAHTLKTAIDLTIQQSLIDGKTAARQTQGRSGGRTVGGRHD